MTTRALLACSALLASAFFLNGQQKSDKPVTPKEVIKLFNGKDLTGLYTWCKKTKRDDPAKVFSVVDGVLRASGEDNGYIATDKPYQDYHLTVEYKWGKRPQKEKYVRNAGILLHGTGPDGAAGSAWMSSIECQLAQGCVGDFIVIRGKTDKGEAAPYTITAETELGSDKRLRWKKGGEKLTWPPAKGQLWWHKHEVGFKELIDTRGKDDVESPLGEWTRVECICAGKKMAVLVNGTVVNECFDVSPAAGKILLQSEGFEIFYRKFEVQPLK